MHKPNVELWPLKSKVVVEWPFRVKGAERLSVSMHYIRVVILCVRLERCQTLYKCSLLLLLLLFLDRRLDDHTSGLHERRLLLQGRKVAVQLLPQGGHVWPRSEPSLLDFILFYYNGIAREETIYFPVVALATVPMFLERWQSSLI